MYGFLGPQEAVDGAVPDDFLGLEYLVVVTFSELEVVHENSFCNPFKYILNVSSGDNQ